MLLNEVEQIVDQLTNQQKKSLVVYIQSKMKRKNNLNRGQHVREIMEQLVGEPIVQKSRRTKLVWARALVAYVLRDEGYTQEYIGDVVGLDHSSVCHNILKVADMLEHPRFYNDIMPLWEELNNILKNETIG